MLHLSRRNFWILFSGLSVLLAAALVALIVAQPAPSSPSVVTTAALPELNSVEEISTYLGDIVVDSDPAKAMHTLETLADTNTVASTECHELVHAIGHAAYTKYGFAQALEYEDDYCGSGYMHGVVEFTLANASDPLAILPTLCPPNDGSCNHGIGHGAMYYVNNDIPEAIKLCDQLAQPADRVNCGEGIFMENFAIDTAHHQAPYLNTEDPLAACVGWAPIYQSACYLYAARYYYHGHMTQPVTEDFSWCEAVPAPNQADCIHGLGSGFMKYHMDEPEQVKSWCEQATQHTEVETCIGGMISYYIVYYASVKHGEWLCQNVLTDYPEICQQELAEKKHFFAD